MCSYSLGLVLEVIGVLLRYWRFPWFCSCGSGKYGSYVGIILGGVGVCCSVGAVLNLAHNGAAGWGGVALFVVIECVGVWLHCWSRPFFYAYGSRAYGVEHALVLERLGV
ncbi:hypothetical protein ACRPOS_007265 [Bartonella heixiaziensis]|uniref:hypothetical protein n=1 Tax=Bartonella heixiaziensis TaxID=1461000 RepID=UPI00390899FB